MLAFLLVFGAAILALFLVQAADIECVNPPKRRPVVVARKVKGWTINAITGTR